MTDRGEESPATAQAGAKPKRKVVRKVKKGSNGMTEAEKKAEAPAENGDAAAKATKDKGPVGYHYWHQQANQGTAPKAAPVKLSEEEADKLAKQMSGTGAGLSSWNKAGTWEERGHTDWAKARVEELVIGKTVDVRGGGVAVVKEVKTFKGDATVVMVRGQPRHGFDFDVTLAWECTFGGDAEDVKPVKGTAHIPEASRDTVEDDEVDYTVKVEDRKTDRRSQEDAAYDALKSGLRVFLRETFATVDKELLARAKGAA